MEYISSVCVDITWQLPREKLFVLCAPPATNHIMCLCPTLINWAALLKENCDLLVDLLSYISDDLGCLFLSYLEFVNKVIFTYVYIYVASLTYKSVYIFRNCYLDILLRHFDKDSHPPSRWATLIFMGNLNRASADLKEATLGGRGKPKWVALKCLNWKPSKYFLKSKEKKKKIMQEKY